MSSQTRGKTQRKAKRDCVNGDTNPTVTDPSPIYRLSRFRFCQRSMPQNLRHLMLFNANESRQHQQTRQFPLARTPSITQNTGKCAKTDGWTRRTEPGGNGASRTARPRNGFDAENMPVHTQRTPAHTRDARTPARHTRPPMHTHTRTRTSTHARTRTPTH